MPNVKRYIVWLDTQLTQLQRDINDHINGHPELKQDAALMASIPGIGDVHEAF